jgi:hypothetical protein
MIKEFMLFIFVLLLLLLLLSSCFDDHKADQQRRVLLYTTYYKNRTQYYPDEEHNSTIHHNLIQNNDCTDNHSYFSYNKCEKFTKNKLNFIQKNYKEDYTLLQTLLDSLTLFIKFQNIPKFIPNTDTNLTILTRTGSREKCLQNLVTTIQSQTNLTNTQHIFTNDKNNSDITNIINNHTIPTNIVNINKNMFKSIGKCFYNIYLNEGIKQIEDSWVIIMDDDSKLIDDNFFDNLKSILSQSGKNDVVLFPIYIDSDKRVLGVKNNKITDIDMCNLAFHSSIFNNIQFTGKCQGDFKILKSMQTSGYNLKYYNNLTIGIWANYSGHAEGGKKICKDL